MICENARRQGHTDNPQPPRDEADYARLASEVLRTNAEMSEAVRNARAAGLTVDFSVEVDGCNDIFKAKPGTFRIKRIYKETTTRTTFVEY